MHITESTLIKKTAFIGDSVL